MGDDALITIDLTEPLLLQPATEYFLAAFPGESTTAAVWHFSYDPTLTWNAEWEWFDIEDGWHTGVVAWDDGDGWQLALPTEEPNVGTPPNDALAAFQINGSAIPEPASAGLLAGACGYLVRRRRERW